MKISVIIPVYNAEKYVTQAVESALFQPETGEVILVEDNSPDNALKVCKELAEKYSKVRLLRHQDGKNHGAGASRNLGIKSAQFDYISFLDADDYYLPGRFSVAQELFDKYPDVHGVYEAIGTHFQDEAGKQKWFANRGKKFHGDNFLTTITEVVEPECLFESLLKNRIGWFCTDGIVVRKSIFNLTGYFIEYLELGEDTNMWLKMSAMGKLIPGRLKIPVGVRRIHSENRVSASSNKLKFYQLLQIKNILEWSYKNQIETNKLEIVFNNYLQKNNYFANQKFFIDRILYKIKIVFSVIFKHPRLLFMKTFIIYIKSIIIECFLPLRKIALYLK